MVWHFVASRSSGSLALIRRSSSPASMPIGIDLLNFVDLEHASLALLTRCVFRPCRHRPSLPTRHRHMPGNCWLLRSPVDDEVVPLWLARDGLVDGHDERGVVGARPDWRAQVRGVILAEAHIERAGAGEANTIAGL